ncbi:MAG: hypothetical protein JSW49_10620 [candidate division WOR-3 bacterium]|nr:MAG: hypothetical protein JSW49_10620 [candidate division WOR-3 bacterium]
MKVLLLLGFFDSFLFPGSILHEFEFNPAHLHRQRIEVLLTSEIRYELTDLRAFGIYSQVQRYGIRAISFGNDLYRENYIELGAGFPIAPGMAVGCNIAGMNCWVKDLKNEFTYSIKIGGIYEEGQFTISGWVNNLNVPRISSVDYAPVSYSLRFGYRAEANLNFDIALRGVETDIPFFNVSVVFVPHKTIRFGMGVNTRPILLEYAMKISLGRMFLSYAGNRHPQLGLTHVLGLGFFQ